MTTQIKSTETYDLDAEKALIGSILVYPELFHSIDIKPSDFYDDRHRHIWKAITIIGNDGGDIDNITVANQLRKDEKLDDIGGPGYLTQLPLATETYNAASYTEIVKDYSARRELQNIAPEVAKLSGSKEINVADIDRLVTRLRNVQASISKIKAADFTSWEDLNQVIGPISWDWKDWLAKGFLNILVGMTGEGKSILSLRICGCYLLGWDWPDGTPFTGETGNVVWCEAEAAQAMNLDRAKKWGLPIEKILSPLGSPLGDFRLNNIEHKDRLTYMAMRPDVVFTVVDSLSGADPTAEKSTEDACNVNWLAALARDTQKPVQLTHHLRKRSLFDIEGVITLDRIRGISTILQYSRLIWALDAPDQTNVDNKRLSVIKSNLAKKPEPIGVTIGKDGAATFGAAPVLPHVETVADKAADLLMALLSDQPMPATELEKEMEHAGISWVSAKRAKQKLGIVSIRKEDSKWYWSLPVRDEYKKEYTDY